MPRGALAQDVPAPEDVPADEPDGADPHAHDDATASSAEEAEDVETARRAEVRRALSQRLAEGTLERGPLAAVHLRLGLLDLEDGADEHAARSLGWAFALDPDVEVPALPEALAARVAAARAEAPGRLRLVLSLEGPAEPLQVDVLDAPGGLVRMIEVTGVGFARRVAWDGAPRTFDPPAEARPVHVRAFDEHGNVVATAGPPPIAIAAPTPEPAEIAAPATPEDAEETNLIENPWFWVFVGVLVIGVAVGVGLTASGERFVLGAPVIE